MSTRKRVPTLVLAALVFISCEPQLQERDNEETLSEVRIGVLEHSSAIPLIVAGQRGYFQRHGVAPAFRELSPAEHMPALLRGDVDIISPSSFPVIFSTVQQNPGEIFCYLAGGETTDGDVLYGIVTRRDSPDRELGDLVGDRIGSASRFTTVNLRNVLRTAFDDEEDETVIVDLSDQMLLLEGLRQGEFDAVVLDQPALSSALTGGEFTVIEENFRAKYLSDPYWSGAGVARLEWGQSNPEVVASILAALDDGLNYIEEHPTATREMFVEHFGLEHMDESAIGMYEYPDAGFVPPAKFLVELVEVLVQNDLLEAPIDPRELFPADLLVRDENEPPSS